MCQLPALVVSCQAMLLVSRDDKIGALNLYTSQETKW